MPDQLPAPMAGVLHRYGPAPHQLAFVSASQRSPPPNDADADAAAAATAADDGAARWHVVLLSGLTEGLLALPYAPLLASRCASLSFELVQAQLRSSYDGWGRAGLDGDAAEVAALVSWLGRARRSRGVVLVGHSTGCQIACRVCERLGREEEEEAKRQKKKEEGQQGGGDNAAATTTTTTTTTTTAAVPPPPPPPPKVLGVVLQAPVSDREYFLAAWPPDVTERRLSDARRAADEGEPERVVAEVEGSAVCARRMLALLERGGDDDMFSRDLTVEELRQGTSVGWLCGVAGGAGGVGGAAGAQGRGREVLVLASGADEYALPLLPEGEGDKGAPSAAAEAAARAQEKLGLVRAAAGRAAEAAGPGAAAVTLQGALHNGAGKEGEVVGAIEGLLRRVLAREAAGEAAAGEMSAP